MGGAQRLGRGPAMAPHLFGRQDHQLGSRFVRDRPDRGDDVARASLLKRASQTEDAFIWRRLARAGFAC
jgi:hypothetical protein